MGSSIPSSPREIRKKFFGADISKYSFEEFEAKLTRIADGLGRAESPLTADELQYILQKAQYVRTGKNTPKENQVRVLKEYIGDILVDKSSSKTKEVKHGCFDGYAERSRD